LGHLLQDMKIELLENICLFSLPVKESEMMNSFLGAPCKDEVLRIVLVQKQTPTGQRTRFKAFVAVGEC
jgi:small subunit ribosomal protein S2e